MNRMKNRRILFVPLAIAGFALFIWLVMLLWNGVLTAAIGVKTISYFQAAGILVLSKILFGFGGGRRWGGRLNNRRWAAMQEKFASMTPEEREQFRNSWKERCNSWRRRDEAPASTPE